MAEVTFRVAMLAVVMVEEVIVVVARVELPEITMLPEKVPLVEETVERVVWPVTLRMEARLVVPDMARALEKVVVTLPVDETTNAPSNPMVKEVYELLLYPSRSCSVVVTTCSLAAGVVVPIPIKLLAPSK